ncbi:MAG TPA: divalent metal cation transporter, partial [Acetobacteraceae bacterium]|nr:divalent metal cation transporter [Acetobacteraceae bacterium]
ISPYLFFWQAAEEAEDEQYAPDARPLREHPRDAPREMRRIGIDTWSGMAYSNLVALAIVIGTAATLHAHGVTDIATAQDAAASLRPIAGPFAEAVFAAGIIGTGLLAVPTLAGSTAYAVGEEFGWTVGLSQQAPHARAFYATLAGATLLGAGMVFSPIDPMKALFWSAVINGVVAVPLMVIIMLMAMRPDVMGRFVLPRPLWAMGWLCTATMAVAVGIMFATW